MSDFNIDLTAVKGPEPLPNGKYLATITEAKPGVSKKGNPKIDLRWRVEAGDYEGRIIFDTMSFTAESMWRVKQVLVAIGFDDKFQGNIDPEGLIGRTAQLTVTVDANRGVDPQTGEEYPERNKVSKVSAPAEDDLLNLVS